MNYLKEPANKPRMSFWNKRFGLDKGRFEHISLLIGTDLCILLKTKKCKQY